MTKVWCNDLNCKFNSYDDNICVLDEIEIIVDDEMPCQMFKQAKITLVRPYRMVIREEEK